MLLKCELHFDVKKGFCLGKFLYTVGFFKTDLRSLSSVCVCLGDISAMHASPGVETTATRILPHPKKRGMLRRGKYVEVKKICRQIRVEHV